MPKKTVKKFRYLWIFLLLLLIGCNKDISISPKIVLPFENKNVKLELVTDSLPIGITGIFFLNAKTGVTITFDGKIYKTTNYGHNWNLQFTNPITDQPFNQIIFTDANVGYVVGGSNSCNGINCISPGGLILKSIDGGDTWTKILQLPSVEFISISSNNLGELFAISSGTKGGIYKSIDYGINWSNIDSDNRQLQRITFSNSYGFCTGMKGSIFRSSDMEKPWSLYAIIPANYLTDIKFKSGSGFCIADNQSVYKTSDNGRNWLQIVNHQTIVYILNPLTSNSCLVFGAGDFSGGDFGTYNGAVLQTTNGGRNWSVTKISNIEPIRYTSFYSEDEGYAISGKKLIKVVVK